MHLVLQELNRNLGSHDFDLGIQIQQIANEAGVIGFGVADDQDIDRLWINLLLKQWDPGVTELGVAGVNQGGAFSAHQKAVVGGSVAQSELNVEAAAFPVEGTDRAAVGRNRLALKTQTSGDGRGGGDHVGKCDGNQL